MSQRPHQPARHNQSPHEQGEAVETVAELLAHAFALGDAEDGRGENRKKKGGVEMGEGEDQFFFPMAM